MQEDEIKSLLQCDDAAFDAGEVSLGILAALDKVILSGAAAISGDAYSVYKKFLPMKQDAPEVMKKELFAAMKNFIKEKITNSEFYDSLFLSRFLIVKTNLSASNCYDIAQCLARLNEQELSLSFLKLYNQKETNQPLKYLTLANFYNLELKDYKTAISYYEKYIKIDETKAVVYTILASLYSKAYGDIGLDDQIRYFEKAYQLKPNDRTVLHGLAFAYERLGDKDMCDKFYRKLLENNPTDTDYYNYGSFLISCGDFKTGHKYFTRRFFTGDKNLQYPLLLEKRWDMKSDIKDKILFVNYEQGFGDTFMYCRFVPGLKEFANKVIFRVQDSLYGLIKSSKLISDGIVVISDKEPVENIKYDFSMALLDAPFVLGVSTENMPFQDGYLTPDENLVKDYAVKYLNKSSNIKAGIAYSGDKAANYNGRDVDICRFKNLFKLKGIDFYSLQADCDDEAAGVIDLGPTFKTFTDTACAIKNMDIVITTDNVILNLAGALGVKTYGLFNYYPNFRWYKLDGDDVGWYNSVKPYKTEENNRWSIVFSKVYNDLSEISKAAALNK